MDNLAAEIVVLKARLAEQTAAEMTTVGELDRALARADAELAAQVLSVLETHRQRRAYIMGLLNELAGNPPPNDPRQLSQEQQRYLQ